MKHFIDLAQIEVKAGNGGDGSASFRREKFVPKGGPDGGKGGDGGSVYAVASTQLATLYDFTHKHKFKAQSGEHGRGAKQFGKAGQDLVMKLPVGTIIYELVNPEDENAELVKIADLKHDQDQVLVAKGGRGGRGNVSFKSSTNQTPQEFEEGTKGGHRYVVLELKVVADIGLIGLPNAGKSTLLSVLTKARPEIAAYPFTTLSPNLGIMEYYDKRIVIADIPGLIEGAAAGKGLGDEFLRHVERTRILVHLIDPVVEDPVESYRTIRQELEAYSAELLDKKEIVVITKTDVGYPVQDVSKRMKEVCGVEVIKISAATGEGLPELQNKIAQVLSEVQDMPDLPTVESTTQQAVPTFGIQDLKHF